MLFQFLNSIFPQNELKLFEADIEHRLFSSFDDAATLGPIGKIGIIERKDSLFNRKRVRDTEEGLEKELWQPLCRCGFLKRASPHAIEKYATIGPRLRPQTLSRGEISVLLVRVFEP